MRLYRAAFSERPGTNIIYLLVWLDVAYCQWRITAWRVYYVRTVIKNCNFKFIRRCTFLDVAGTWFAVVDNTDMTHMHRAFIVSKQRADCAECVEFYTRSCIHLNRNHIAGQASYLNLKRAFFLVLAFPVWLQLYSSLTWSPSVTSLFAFLLFVLAALDTVPVSCMCLAPGSVAAVSFVTRS